MKNIFNNIILLTFLAFIQVACEKDQTLTVAKSNATASTLTSTKTSIVLNEAGANQEAMTFSWNATDYGFNAATNYSLEFGKKGTNFANGKTVDLGSSKESKLTVAALNAIANQIGLEGFKAGEMEARVKANIGGGLEPVYSNILIIAVTPYLDKPPYQTLYLVGDATEGGWSNTAATPIFRNPADPFLFTFTGAFNQGHFKFLGVLGQWAPMWGSNGSGGVAFRNTEADPDPATFQIMTAGYYTVTLNLRNNSFSLTPFNASTAKLYNSIGIIGPFTNWSNIAPMSKSALNPHIWTIDYTFSEDTEMKFRIAEGWDENWGAESNATESSVYGIGTGGGPNFKVKKGRYIIRFNDITKHYIFITK